MSKFSMFMKKNKITKENGFYVATTTLCDEKGEPLKWEFRHVTSKEDTDLREKCIIEVQVTGKPNAYRQRMKTSEYILRLICKSVVTPDLFDAELQDSYGVKTPEELLHAMVDDPGEYNDLAAFIQKFQGFSNMDEEIEEAKN